MSEFGVPTQGQLDKINALAKRTLSKDEVFAFSTKMVGDALLPERYLKLHKSLLEVYKNDARTGVAFMLDHAWSGMQKALVYGRTFDASLKKSDGGLEDETWALHGDTYIVRGKEKDGISTDSIIADIEDGTLFDVSIGFGFETGICSICGNNYYKYDECQHFRGREYDGQLCYIIAKPPGYLMELSGVFDGAYPTAGVLSQMGLPEGQSDFIQLPDEELKKLPSGIMTYATYGSNSGRLLTYHKKDDLVKGNVFSVPDLSTLKGGGEQVSEEKTYTQEQVDALVKESVDKAVEEAMAKQTEEKPNTEEPTSAFMSAEQAKEALGQEVPADKVLLFAKEGIEYRKELKEEALKAGVRAMGDAFKQETWERNFDLMDVQGIKDTMATWQAQAEVEIPAGRQTQAGLGREQKLTMPEEAFKVGR